MKLTSAKRLVLGLVAGSALLGVLATESRAGGPGVRVSIGAVHGGRIVCRGRPRGHFVRGRNGRFYRRAYARPRRYLVIVRDTVGLSVHATSYVMTSAPRRRTLVLPASSVYSRRRIVNVARRRWR